MYSQHHHTWLGVYDRVYSLVLVSCSAYKCTPMYILKSHSACGIIYIKKYMYMHIHCWYIQRVTMQTNTLLRRFIAHCKVSPKACFKCMNLFTEDNDHTLKCNLLNRVHGRILIEDNDITVYIPFVSKILFSLLFTDKDPLKHIVNQFQIGGAFTPST